MDYERFSQLWDALVTDRAMAIAAAQNTNGMSETTATALIEYGLGDKSKIDSVRDIIGGAKPGR